MGFSYNGMVLGFHSRISLEIQPNIIKIEKYFVVEFLIMYPAPQDLYDPKIWAPNSVWKSPNDVAKHVWVLEQKCYKSWYVGSSYNEVDHIYNYTDIIIII